MIKAVFFDFDGTLLSHTTRQIPASTKRSLARLRGKNIRLFISTGRHLTELEAFPMEDISFDGYITLNGQLVLDEHKQILFGSPFAPIVKDGLVSLFEAKEIPIILVEEKHIYINFVNELVKQVQEEISSAIPKVLAYDGQPVYQASTYLKRGDEAQLERKLPKGCKLARWSDGGVDIISKHGGKVEGIKSILNRYGIRRTEIMAFGDAENDIDMLEYAQIGVAMGNGTEKAKKSADFVTAPIDEDGIEKALERFLKR